MVFGLLLRTQVDSGLPLDHPSPAFTQTLKLKPFFDNTTSMPKDQVLDYVSHPVAIQDLGCSNNTGTSCVTKFLLVELSQPCSSVVRAPARKAEGLKFNFRAGQDPFA